MKRVAVLLILATLTLLLAGCRQPQGTYAGALPDGETLIGLATSKGQIIAYVCNGSAISEWFRGEVQGSRFSLTNANGSVLEGRVSGGEVSATLVYSGEHISFTAPLATGDAGLYRAEETIDGADYVAGWVVLPDGRQTGRITNITDGTSNTAVPRLSPADTQIEVSGLGSFTPLPGSEFIDPTTDI